MSKIFSVANRVKHPRLMAVIGAGGRGIYLRDGISTIFIRPEEDGVDRHSHPLEQFSGVQNASGEGLPGGRINVYEGDTVTIQF